MALIPSSKRKFYQEDVAGGVSVSEFLGGTIGANINFVYNYITRPLLFGVTGAAYSGLSSFPHTGTNSSEICVEGFDILRLTVSNQISGTSGDTVFYIERRPYLSGSFSTIFSTNCTIANTAADNLFFSSDAAAPSGVTLPVLNLSTLSAGDELRLVIVSAAVGAKNLQINLEVSPNGL